MLEIKVLPQSKFTKKIRELNGMDKEAWLGLAALLGAGAAGIGAGITAKGMAGEQEEKRKKTLEDIRKKLGEAPPSMNSPEGLKEAMKIMQQRFNFNPETGSYYKTDGSGIVSNRAYNRRLGAMARGFSNHTPEGYANRVKNWQAQRRGDVNKMLTDYDQTAISPWTKPSFYAKIPGEMLKKIKSIFTGVNQ